MSADFNNLAHLKHLHHPHLTSHRLDVEHAQELLSQIEQKTSLSLLHQNCQSLQQHFEEFFNFIQSLPISFSIYAVSELWCNNLKDFSHLDTLEGYTLIPKPRKRKGGGGVAFYIKDSILYKIVPIEIKDVDSLWIEIQTPTKKEVIAVVYRNEDVTPTNFSHSLEPILAKFQSENTRVTLCGDMNIDLKHLDYTSTYVQTLMYNQFWNLIRFQTHTAQQTHEKSCIDHIITNKDCTVHAGVIQNDICRHDATFAVFLGGSSKPTTTKTFTTDFSRYDKEKFNKRLSDKLKHWKQELPPQDRSSLDETYSQFIDILLETWKEFVSLKIDKNISKLKKPWMTCSLLKCVQKQHTLYAKCSKDPTNQVLRKKHRTYKNILTSALTAAKKKYHDAFINAIKTEPKTAWEKLKQLMGKAKRKISKKHNLTANEFCDFFTNVGPDLAAKIPDSDEDPVESMKFQSNKCLFLRPATVVEIINLLQKLDTTKSVGSDGVSALLLKEGADTIAIYLKFLFDLSFKHGKVFDLMKLARITALHKAEDVNTCSNYRPISVLSTLSKILEKLVHERVSDFFQDILTKKQFGFRKNLKTELALINFYQDLIDKLDKGYIGLGVFVDLKKAFDTVNHEILLKKLEKYGVTGNALKWMRDYLSNRQQYVRVNSKNKSEPQTVRCGVPQGSILGPLLFIIYINDFPEVLKILDSTIYADDTTLMAFGKDLENLEETVNEDLKHVAKWFQRNKLTLNIKKTNYIVFSHETRHSVNQLIHIKINGQQIKRTDNIRHLGVIFHQHLRWQPHINHILKKIVKFLIVFSYMRKYVDTDKLMMMYNSFIYPHLTYCVTIWGIEKQNMGVLDHLLRFQKKLARIILYAPIKFGPKVHAAPLLHKLKMLDIHEICKLHHACLAHSIINHTYPTININLTYICNTHSYPTAHSQNKTLRTHFTKTSTAQRGIQYSIEKTWNNLPHDIRNLDTVKKQIFKKAIKDNIFDAHKDITIVF
eukprot:Lithocolla_globosa_v1_NODE_468_length_3964_cov_97.214377.p1 type:complete len:993 gc:universal NODE_468_length_3964_cov_97.214377:917-3895(+)